VLRQLTFECSNSTDVRQPAMKPAADARRQLQMHNFSARRGMYCCAPRPQGSKRVPSSEATGRHVRISRHHNQSQGALELISKPLVVLLASPAASPQASQNCRLSEPLSRGDLMAFAADNDALRPAPASWQLSALLAVGLDRRKRTIVYRRYWQG
jgi:hypothetical protein